MIAGRAGLAACVLGGTRRRSVLVEALNKSLRHKSGGSPFHVPFTTVNVSWFDSGGPPAATAPVAGSSVGVVPTFAHCKERGTFLRLTQKEVGVIVWMPRWNRLLIAIS